MPLRESQGILDPPEPPHRVGVGREVIGGESMRHDRVKRVSGAAPVLCCVRLPCPVQAVLVVVHRLPSVDSLQDTD